MTRGISYKLMTTYMAVIIASAISGFFCFFVLNMNKKSNERLRYVIMPSLTELKDLRFMFQESKRYSSSWIVTSNNKDQEELTGILQKEYPQLAQNLNQHGAQWVNASEREMLAKINHNDSIVIAGLKQITLLLNNEEAYLDDARVGQAIDIQSNIVKVIAANEKLFETLITLINQNVEIEQKNVDNWLLYLYIVVAITAGLITIIAIISIRFTRSRIINPLLDFGGVITHLSSGDVVKLGTTTSTDEIGQMHNAIAGLVQGIEQKIEFAEQIGKGNYNTEFRLLSDTDKLGLALLEMRSELQQSRAELLEQDRRLLDAQRLAKVGNYYFYTRTGSFQSSTAFDEILGIDDKFDRMIQNWTNLILPEYRLQVREKARISMETGAPFHDQYKLKKYNSDVECWVVSNGEVARDKDGNIIAIYGTLQDITESKTLELELQESYRLATEQNKRLANFSYIVSHNLRMHAVNINGLLSLIDDTEDDDEKLEMIGLLKKAAGHLDETMHHLNDVVAMQNAVNVEIEPQKLVKHIEHALDVLKTRITSKNVVIENNIPEDTTVNYNSAYLESIVLNLISNAIKYSNPERQPVIKLNFYQEVGPKIGPRWVFEVADNGIGIDMNRNGHKLFGMYKTFHNNKDAKGIGLFMTRYQVESMGGEILVESELGKGTIFRVYMRQ